MESVSFRLNDVIKSIDKLYCLRKLDCEIYIELWSRNSTDLGVNLSDNFLALDLASNWYPAIKLSNFQIKVLAV